MRVVLQRVKQAQVTVNGSVVGSSKKGLCLFVGISQDFDESKLDYMINKILKLKCFEDENGNNCAQSITDIKGDLLVISQFTLYGRTHKGSKPDFSKAMKYKQAEDMFNLFISTLKQKSNLRVETGEFGAMMDVELINDGPFTLILEK